MAEQDFTHGAFQKYLSEHKLMGTRCKDCGASYLPPRPMCTQCHSIDMEWIELPQEGQLTAFSTIHIAPTEMIAAGYGRDRPYCAGIVKLQSGLSISGQILGVDASQPEMISIGMPVRADFIERGDGDAKKTFLAFRVV